MIYIVIPVHNRKVYTLDCLSDLSIQTITDQVVIVVDDGSTDGTADVVRQQFPAVVMLTGDGSLWWAGAMNLGIRYVLDHLIPDADDFILALNDDIHIGPDYLATLLSAYQDHKPCVVGSVSADVKPPHALLYAGTGHNLLFPDIDNWASTRFKNSYSYLLNTSPFVESDSLPGRGMLIPQPVLKAIGLFDEQRFRHHMADLDFSIRARKAGFPLIVSATSLLYEYPEATGVLVSKPMSLRAFWDALSSIKSPIDWRVRYRFARKHTPLPYLYFTLDMLRIIAGYSIRQTKRLFEITF